MVLLNKPGNLFSQLFLSEVLGKTHCTSTKTLGIHSAQAYFASDHNLYSAGPSERVFYGYQANGLVPIR